MSGYLLVVDRLLRNWKIEKMNLQQKRGIGKMASSRRSDYGEEFVERLRKDRFRKAYILVNGISSEEDEDEELCFEDEDDEIVGFRKYF